MREFLADKPEAFHALPAPHPTISAIGASGGYETHAFFQKHNVESTFAPWPGQGEGCAESLIREGKIDLAINLPNENSEMLEHNYTVRRAAVDFDTPLLNNFVTTKLFVEALEQHHKEPMLGVNPTNLFEHYSGEDANHKWTRSTAGNTRY